MSADAFIVFYGVEMVLSSHEVGAVETRSDERITRARSGRLDSHLGRVTDGESHYLLVGKKIAWLGLEYESEASCSDDAFTAIREEVRKKLFDAGFAGEPKLIFKLEAQF